MTKITQEFEITPKKRCTVQRVMFRESLIRESIDYSVKVCPLLKKNAIYVAIKGERRDNGRYWRAVRDKKILPPLMADTKTGRRVDFTVTDLRGREEISDRVIGYCIVLLGLDLGLSGLQNGVSGLKESVPGLGKGVAGLRKEVRYALKIATEDKK